MLLFGGQKLHRIHFFRLFVRLFFLSIVKNQNPSNHFFAAHIFEVKEMLVLCLHKFCLRVSDSTHLPIYTKRVCNILTQQSYAQKLAKWSYHVTHIYTTALYL